MEQIQRKTRRLELVLGPEDGGVKVDTLLRRRLHLSGTVIRRIKWLPDGILVDGARVNTAFRPREGQTLSVRLSDPERRSGILPAPGPLDIVYEDGDLLILDEWGYVPVDKDGSQLLFRVISDSYESKSLILTTNLEFSKWGGIFTDDQMAAAMIDRLVHHGHLLIFEGKSYRMEHALMRQDA